MGQLSQVTRAAAFNRRNVIWFIPAIRTVPTEQTCLAAVFPLSTREKVAMSPLSSPMSFFAWCLQIDACSSSMGILGNRFLGDHNYIRSSKLSLRSRADLYLQTFCHYLLHAERLRRSACIPPHYPSWPW